MAEDVREMVRDRYASAAKSVGADACCTDCGCGTDIGSKLYGLDETAGLPGQAVLASLGCGNPMTVAELKEGETVLDLGSGGGIDVFLSARRVGQAGKVYGLDMTDEMLALANKNKAEAGITNAEFLKGYIEEIPLPANTIDVVISNCVINLSSDKSKVFSEMARVLKPGGRIGITDIVAENHLTEADRAERGSYVGCIAGALSFAEYENGLRSAGFDEISIEPSHVVAQEMLSATIKATRI